MRWRRKIAFGMLLLFVAIQFIRPARNESKGTLPTDIFNAYPAPPAVQALVKSSCYDCHSNSTAYPWYAAVQPVAWWLARHINEGKQELNFNEFGAYPHRRQPSKLKNIAGSIQDGSMPLSLYTLIHTNARLTENDKKTIVDWLNRLKDSLSTAWSAH